MSGIPHDRPGRTGDVVSSAIAIPGLNVSPANPASRARSLRVSMLIIAIIALSMGDLSMTMTFLRSVGMGEGNPVARLVIAYDSPALLVAWKCASVMLACLIFAVYRKKAFTEVACWCCVGILCWLTVRWWNYASETTELSQHLHAIATATDRTDWVQLSQ